MGQSSSKSTNRISDSLCASHCVRSYTPYRLRVQSTVGLEDSKGDKSKCQDRFDAYKECRKQERELRLEANRKRVGSQA